MMTLSNPVNSFSNLDLIKNGNLLKEQLNHWLNSELFRPIKEKFLEKIKTDDIVRVIIQTEDPLLRRLPWYLWDLFASYRLAEVALFSSAFERVEKLVKPKPKVRILAILGDKTGIDINADRKFLENLSNAEPEFLVEPNRQEFNEKLWDENGWDILFFAGHSSSNPDGTTGKMYINSKESLTIPDLKYALQKAIERGLQLAIFNSCDGLGIARDLTELQMPQMIVMREPVPDLVAQEFLKYFLSSFSNGNSLYISVREAREQLHGLEKDFPCASWLPVICQNPAENPVSWSNLYDSETSTPIWMTLAGRGLGVAENAVKAWLGVQIVNTAFNGLRAITSQKSDNHVILTFDILSQLQPTPQTYPLPINIQSLADETDTITICQELCTLIYSLALPDTGIPTVSNFAQLKQQILTLKKQLQKRNLALIFHNCKPHLPLLTCCRKIADANLGLHILWITDETLEVPLRGFPPSQENLLGAVQSWIEELC
ncbi:CHAT domain-containing protein [Planktothrix mougeotii LEGE 06226]|uniref:CHAT domain-containing protein n=2 Tax=Planktothrix mougeotii TaxID=54306 RepID=A0ABR9UEQ1_9CYAN|nr:CHAT domain-containing protein [Planktothrix mougeotii LEGE 06226]